MSEIKLMDHNVPVYESILENLETNDILLYVTATGTGKSYVTSKLIQELNYKALVICPKKSICNQWSNLIDVDVMTYQKFARFSNSDALKLVSDYDLIVLDEAHHAGAYVWKSNIKFISHYAKDYSFRIIGLTADPNRYSDISNDIIGDIFNENVVYGYTLDTAINNNILPSFTYVSSLFTYPSKKDIYETAKKNNVTNLEPVNKLIGKLNYGDTNIVNINDIVHKHLPKDKRKIVVFIPEIKDMEKTIDLMHDVFSDVSHSIYGIHSYMTDEKCNEQIDLFKKCDDEISILISINMLNEGLHVSGVDTVIMLRKTTSASIFFQQIGRALSSSQMESEIVVFDFVGNKNSLEMTQMKINNDMIDIFDIQERLRMISDQNIIIDYTMKDIEIISEINKLIGNVWEWTPEEDAIVRRYYPTEHGKVAKRLPGRTPNSVRLYAIRIGITKQNKWTPEEDDIIRKYYPSEGTDVCKRLNNRSSQSVKIRAHSLKISVNQRAVWKNNDYDDILKKYYPIEGCDIIKRFEGTGLTIRQIKSRAGHLGLKTNSRVSWSQEEDDIIRKYYPTEGKDIVKRLPGRTISSIQKHATAIGVHASVQYWTPEECEIITKYYPTEGNDIVKRLPGRTIGAIRGRAIKLGVKKQQFI